MDPTKSELEAKLAHDGPHHQRRWQVWVAGAVVVGAGPSGLAVAACLKVRGIPSLILDRADCLGSLWRVRTYDRLRLHLPKQFCQLPFLPFPSHFPTYLTRDHFISYLDSYANHFHLRPTLGQAVVEAWFDNTLRLWRVRTSVLQKTAIPSPTDRSYTTTECTAGVPGTGTLKELEYLCRWLVVATGENTEPHEPEFEGRGEFVGPVFHSSEYRSGKEFEGKKVLVVGCGNSGMEVALDLCDHNAMASLVVRHSVHVLPQQMLGTSTFGLLTSLLKWFPVKLVDRFLLVMSRLMLGDTAQLGLTRPSAGPLEYKAISGKTPVLDIGTVAKIRAGDIKVYPEIRRLARQGVEFLDGRKENFDTIILATGYKSNVPSWLKDTNMLSEKDGHPVKPFTEGWKGENGLYGVGFTKVGLLGASVDAMRVAEDIERVWKTGAK
ncbi:hypothetical protein Cgig2_018658 [Carnegiea gigantea]|uniref:Flavin-containing monooxygenase n=1 Tax=Carnegiea gigantea TaxID=171969 RepID=A0A9Q1KFP3_9CARY|nr:hypothetical protein Cgig2_018658 [Carnegiea gigantea]